MKKVAILGLFVLGFSGIFPAAGFATAEHPLESRENVPTEITPAGISPDLGALPGRGEGGAAETATFRLARPQAAGDGVARVAGGVAVPGSIGAAVVRASAARVGEVGTVAESPELLPPADGLGAVRDSFSTAVEPLAVGAVTVRVTPTAAIPIPSAAWLFGSALIAFVTWSRRRAP